MRIVIPVFIAFLLVSSGLTAAEEFALLVDFELWNEQVDAGSTTYNQPSFSLEIGSELDVVEREKYWLLPGMIGFRSAHLLRDDKGNYRLKCIVDDGGYETTRSRRISAAALRLTRLHCWLVETYHDLPTVTGVPLTEDERLHRVALRYATFGRYDLVRALVQDLINNFAGTEAAAWATDMKHEIDNLLANRRVLVWDQAVASGEGYNDIKLFGGYYGVWMGLAIPIALESDDASAYGLGLIVGGPLGYTLAGRITRHADISEGRATMIALGGNLGTWQGLGWAAIADADVPAVVGTGVATGLLGIASAIWLTNQYEFTEGHAALIEAGMTWGAWFGLVVAGIADAQDDGVLTAVLLGSDALVLAAGRLAKGSLLSEKQVRLIGLNGVLGTVMGFGVDLLLEVDSGQTAWMIAGLGGVAGLVNGFRVTAGKGEVDLVGSRGLSGSGLAGASCCRHRGAKVHFPVFMTRVNRMNRDRMMPAAGALVRF